MSLNGWNSDVGTSIHFHSNIIYSMHHFIWRWGWTTSSTNISYGPPLQSFITTIYRHMIMANWETLFKYFTWSDCLTKYGLGNIIYLTGKYPAGTWRKYNVASTSMQRHDVASTLRRRYIYVIYNVASTSMQRHDVVSTLRRRYICVMCLPGKYLNYSYTLLIYVIYSEHCPVNCVN